MMLLFAASPALAQQPARPPSIDAWLQSERDNANLQKALQAYQEAQAAAGQPVAAAPPSRIPAAQPVPETSPREVPPVFEEQRIKDYGEGAGSAGQRGIYAALRLGNVFVTESNWYDDDENVAASMSPLGLYAAGAMGLDVGYGLSVEAEIGVQHAEIDELEYTTSNSPGLSLTASNVDGNMSALSMMANARFAVPVGGPVAPYVTGGIGFAHIEIEDVGGFDDSDFVFAYQGGLGMLWPITERTSLDFGYRYFAASDADMETDNGVPFSAEFDSHIALIGLQHKL